ncbi:heme o synthase [Candidatus Persebacteraceae bacterium Df01]|jgi:protoheme IX farnesyltransferase|uniref:Protoheme IX farnesyltransferase n=1 Tax=Candidatus Doriopsillibacter californiensis TaxID=2970740 RepID=A0ABT7QK51_9GAMM|nr:heme o synthase [Candidatus Persebacteraceae bacterium Df01]
MISAALLARDFLALTKPRVVALIAFTAAVGSALAMLQHPADPAAVCLTLLGITLVSAAAAACNCMVESYVDSVMKRTRFRPLPAGRINLPEAAGFSILLGISGLWLTVRFGGVLTALMTAATFFGYTVVYTLYLKRATPQNIVIGGASGAMPPLLGWLAVSGTLTFEPLLLFLIIFVWTPPHFWALALYRADDYARAGLPMLPVTHGKRFTATQIVLYGIILLAVSLLPFIAGMSGIIYLSAAAFLGIRFIRLSWRLRQTLADDDGRRLFSYSITYLALLFAAMFVDAFVGATFS